MSNYKSISKLLFVNGVNTNFGGSVSGAINVWKESFEQENISYEIFNTIPKFRFRSKGFLYYLVLVIYFFPGTLFRMFNIQIFEFFYKVSPFLIISFIYKKIKYNPPIIIFSHHAIFFLAFFSKKNQRIFLIQDLIYIRAKSKGASRKIQRIYFSIELFIYKYSPTLFVLSYHEQKILRRFLSSNIYLIRSWGIKVYPNIVKYDPSRIAVISDWRRPENIHGVLSFFKKKCEFLDANKILYLNFYGFDSDKIIRLLKPILQYHNIVISNAGTFRNLSDIDEGYFFVPIYHGAGIKLKTIEGIALNRLIIGTKAAFIGLPPWIIRNVIKITNSPEDFSIEINRPDTVSFISVNEELSLFFIPIGKAPIFLENSNILT